MKDKLTSIINELEQLKLRKQQQLQRLQESGQAIEYMTKYECIYKDITKLTMAIGSIKNAIDYLYN